MSDPSPGPGWWLASDGKWYPPKEAEKAPAPGWWLASDGKWYPPKEADEAPGPGWWLASDGKWYAPEARANGTTTPPGSRSPAAPATPAPQPAPNPSGQSEPKPKGKTSRRGRGGRRGRGKTDTPTPPPEVSTAPAAPAEPEPQPKPAPKQEPAVAGSPSTRLVTRSDVPAQDHIRPNLTEGLTPLEQIERRNQASRADASVQAARRAAAASRALGQLQAQIDIDMAEAAARAATELTPPPAAAPTPAPVTRATRPPVQAATPTPAPPVEREPQPIDDAPPLLEVKTSPLGADLEHLGDRLAIFVDRVELRDRLDRVRNSIQGDDIVDVVVNKRLTGAVLSVESVHGPGIAAKGLRPDQADEARQLILDKTRPARLGGRDSDNDADAPPPVAPKPVATVPAKPTTATPTAGKPAAPKVDAVALRSKLADLHNAGVLTDDEYQQKLLVVRRLASGETLRTG